MNKPLLEELNDRMDGFTSAERQIANYIITQQASLPFENAASLAQKLDVSAITVGRFCRSLGYKHFRELKEALRSESVAAPWLVGDQLRNFREHYRDELRRSLDTEIAGLVEAYGLIDTPAWKATVKLLSDSDTVHVMGFQTERGMAVMLANSLQYLREGVELVDPASGHYADLFIRKSKKRCLVLVDCQRYSRQTLLLAEKAHAVRLPLVMITDKQCDWARRYTPNVIAVSTESGQFWSSSIAMTAAIQQLINSVVARSGNAVEKRLDAISSQYAHFIGFSGTGKR